MEEQRTRVKATAICNQTQAKQSKVVSNRSGADPPFNILHLNDYTLEHVCKVFSLSQQIQFARLCERFRYIFTTLSRRAYEKISIDITAGLTQSETIDFYRFAGENIIELKGEIIFEHQYRAISLANVYCINLERIYLSECRFNDRALNKILNKNFKSVKELRMQQCSLRDRSIPALFQMKSLEILSLPYNFELTGHHLWNLRQLKDLCLYGCTNLRTRQLINICKYIPGLRSLDVRRCEKLLPAAFEAMPVHCSQLEVLKMSCLLESFECVAQIQNLKQLELLRCSRDKSVHSAEIFQHIAKYKANQLTSLVIISKEGLTSKCIVEIIELKKLTVLCLAYNRVVTDSVLCQLCLMEDLQELIIKNCLNVTNDGALAVLRCCKQLRHLNVQMCPNISVELVPKAIQILELRKFEMARPISMLVNGTSIRKPLLDLVTEYNEETRAYLLKIDFEAVPEEKREDLIDAPNLWGFGEPLLLKLQRESHYRGNNNNFKIDHDDEMLINLFAENEENMLE